MLILFCSHVIYVLGKLNWSAISASLAGPESLVPRPRDASEFVRHVAWFLGARRVPQFDRWGYWEKFDYWAVFWGMAIIGGTGLILYSPVVSSRYLPGWSINVALWIHRIEAMLAMAHLFIIHFFVAHLRRTSFPMDRAMFAGSVPLDHVRRERPAWIARLEEQGRLPRLLVADSPPALRVVQYVFGYAVMAVALFLLIGAMINGPHVTW
jgi:cytochrome b subunit of formate dehydrogenase